MPPTPTKMIEDKSGDGGRVECSQCLGTYSNKNELDSHIISIHNKVDLPKDTSDRESCDQCNTSFINGELLRRHVTTVHTANIIAESGGIQIEKKSYTTSQLKLLLKKKHAVTREEGPANIRVKNRKGEETSYKGSVSVDLETASFEFMKREGFAQMQRENKDIKEIKTVRIVNADTEDCGEAGVEYICLLYTSDAADE